MRASLFNLIIVSPDNARRDYVKKITSNVIKRFPCRVIFITIVDMIPEIKVHASATSGIGGDEEIACDMIEIASPPSLLSKIPFLILPHFLPDLPIYLLWAEELHQYPELFHGLKKWSTRLIFDSEVSDNLAAFCKTLKTLSEERDVADLNWARTENWRELLAATFYSSKRLESLLLATKIDIHYNNFETPSFCHTQIQALYLQAWLTTCMAWKEPPKFTLTPHQNKDLAPGTVLSIDILCKDQTHFSFKRDPSHPHQILTIICDEEKCEIPSRFIFSKAQSGLSLVNLIYHPDPSSHFPAVLEHLS